METTCCLLCGNRIRIITKMKPTQTHLLQMNVMYLLGSRNGSSTIALDWNGEKSLSRRCGHFLTQMFSSQREKSISSTQHLQRLHNDQRKTIVADRNTMACLLLMLNNTGNKPGFVIFLLPCVVQRGRFGMWVEKDKLIIHSFPSITRDDLSYAR